MALKFEIIGNNLVVTDTADNSVKLERPAADVYAICETDKFKLVTRTDRNDILLTKDYTGLVDSANTGFSKDTFTNFCRHSLGALKQGGFTFIDPSLVPVLSGPQAARTDINGVVAGTLNNTASMPDGSTRDLMTMRQKAQSLKNNAATISCAAGATTNLKQVRGAAGDMIASVEVVITATPLSAPVRLKDGNNTSYDILPADAPVGTSVIALNRKSLSGGWQAILPANCTANVTGEFQ